MLEMSQAHFEAKTHTRFLKFMLGGAPYLLPLLSVRDVIESPERSSEAPPAPCFQGTTKFLGTSLPVMDLRLKFGKKPSSDGSCIVVCGFDRGYSLGFRVDHVVSFLSVDPGTEIPAGVTLVDPEKLLSPAEKKAAAAASGLGGKAA